MIKKHVPWILLLVMTIVLMAVMLDGPKQKVVSEIGYSDFVGFANRLDGFKSIFDEAWRTRAVGDFWSHMLVAEGAVDIAAEPKLALWDMAAVSIIVTEAGGRFSDLEDNAGPFGSSGVSTNGHLHRDFITAIRP